MGIRLVSTADNTCTYAEEFFKMLVLTYSYIEGSWAELTIGILGKIPLNSVTTILPICLVIDLTLTNIIAKYDQNLKSTKK